MIKIIFRSAVRSLVKYKHISAINLLGLMLGITSFLFILHYLLFEFSFDSFIPRSENVYRVNLLIKKDGQNIYHGAKTARGLYFALKNQIPEVEANGIAYFEKCLVNYKNISYANQDILWVDEGFEEVFPLDMLEGVADYSRPRTGLISATCAKTFFGAENPVGKIIRINQGMPIEITGIFNDLPSNSHMSAQFFASVKTWVEMGAIGESDNWQWNAWWNYVRLKEGVLPEVVNEKINSLAATYMSFLTDDNRHAEFSLQPLHDLHFISGIEGEMGAHTNRSSLYNLIAIALITLLIAWINYVNLAMAHAQARSLQIGMRKLIGASGMHLWLQSLAESTLVNLAALVLSMGLYFIFVGTFARIFSIPIELAYVPLRYMIILPAATILFGILLSSIYHGIVLSGIKTLPEHTKHRQQNFKNVLVMVQILMSIIFLTCTIIVFRQISYMKNKDLGIVLDDVVIVTGPASLNDDPLKRQRFEAFKNELLGYSGFVSATFNMLVPGQEPGWTYREIYNPSTGASPDIQFFENNTGEGFILTYQMKLLAGRDFSREESQNLNKIIINQTSMRLLDIASAEEAIGQQVYRRGNDSLALEIVGVVSDFHNEGLQKPIYPVIWNNQYPWEFGFFAVRVHSRNVSGTIDRLKDVWNKHYSNDNFDFVFAREQFNRQYHSESRFGRFYLWLTILSVGITAMGLYGFILFTFENRTREIGIRKVNGARVSEILALLNYNFIKWVAIAFVIATPIAWYIMNSWLQHYACRTEMSWWIFVLAGAATLGISLLTLSWQSWRAATRNPVEALRYE